MLVVAQEQNHAETRRLCLDEAVVAGLFGSPGDRPLMPVALRRLAAASVAAQLTRFGNWADQVQRDMCQLAVQTPERSQDLSLLMDGRRAEYPVWAKLVGHAEFSPLGLELLGYELCLAFAQQRQVRRSVIDRVVSISVAPQTFDRRYVAKMEAEARGQCARRQSGVPAQVLRVNSVVSATIAVEMSFKDPEKRQATEGSRTLPAPLVRAVAGWLHLQNDATSIVTTIGFVSGLTWDAVKLVPVGDAETDTIHVCLIDVARGVIRIDLKGLIPAAKTREGCEEAELVVNRPLPERTAQMLREIFSRNPSATCLGDLLPTTSNKQQIGDFGHRVSISKFLASRGLAALEAGLDRKVAAYCTGAFSLVGRSEHHYLHFKPEEIGQGCTQLYAWLEWTAGVEPKLPTRAIGSGVTPTMTSVLSLEEKHAGRVEQLRVSRRTTLSSLLDFHNSYAVFCVHRFAFFTLARAADEYSFNAAAFHPDCSFGTLIDKRAGPFGCATPLPMPVSVSVQVELWLAHLRAMDRRLTKMGWAPQADARAHLQRVIDGEDCALFFQITPEGDARIPGSTDVFAGTDLKGDGYRHFVSNELRSVGLAAEIVEAVCRHVVPHATVFSIASVASPARWLRDAAQALDLVAARLNLRPVSGLRRVVQ